MRFRWWAIEGLIGAGKTTTAQIVAANLNIPAVLEETRQHPFIDDYYQDPQLFSFETELAFMAIHLHEIKAARDTSGGIVSDFSPAKNPIFGELNLPKTATAALREIDSLVWRPVGRPDIAVFLDVPPTWCLERIRRRGRPVEQSLKLGDLETLRTKYLARLSELADSVILLELQGQESADHVAREIIRRVS